MKHSHIYPLLLGLLCASTAPSWVSAQTDTSAATPMTRDQVKRDRDEFLRMHRYDTSTDNWVLKEGMEPPSGIKTRAQVKAERDEFMRIHRYDQSRDTWVPTETPRDMSTMTREQVREETNQFLRTHQWDENSSAWVAKKGNTPKQ